jgi:hypothetical protein
MEKSSENKWKYAKIFVIYISYPLCSLNDFPIWILILFGIKDSLMRFCKQSQQSFSIFQIENLGGGA